MITTAASAGWGQVLEQTRDQHDHQDDQNGSGDSSELGLRAGSFGHRRRRPAGADREPLEEAGGQVRCADPDHLAVTADLLPSAGHEGANLRELMDRMGHSTTRAAMAYCTAAMSGSRPSRTR